MQNARVKEVFDLKYFSGLDGFEKLKYISEQTGVGVRELAHILEEEVPVVEEVLKQREISHRADTVLFEKFYHAHMLFAYLLKMANYQSQKLQRLWTDASDYAPPVRVPPPWYPIGLKEYLGQYRYDGLISCIDWISKRYESARH